MNIAVVGFGYIGSVMGAVLAARGHRVFGVDQSQRLVDTMNSGQSAIPEPGLTDLINSGVASGQLSIGTDVAAVAQADVIIVTVGTPLSDSFDADLSHISAACAGIAPHLRDGQLLMVKSTVPPGVTRRMAEEFLLPAARIHVAFSPERLAEGNAIREFETLPIVIGGLDRAATDACAEFWRNAMGNETIAVGSPEAAELVKLADNQWIDLNIALANELAKLCDALPYDVDVLEVIRGANSLKKGQHYVNILTPSNGVGGYCLTKDPWFIDALGKRHGAQLSLSRTGREVNDSMPDYVFERIDAHLGGNGARVALLGYSFKTNSGDVRFTPVAPLVKRLTEAGYDVRICDPTVVAHEASEQGVTLAQDWREAVDGADCVAILAAHDAFAGADADGLAQRVAPGALIYDGRRYFDRDAIDAIRARGLAYAGVGR